MPSTFHSVLPKQWLRASFFPAAVPSSLTADGTVPGCGSSIVFVGRSVVFVGSVSVVDSSVEPSSYSFFFMMSLTFRRGYVL